MVVGGVGSAGDRAKEGFVGAHLSGDDGASAGRLGGFYLIGGGGGVVEIALLEVGIALRIDAAAERVEVIDRNGVAGVIGTTGGVDRHGRDVPVCAGS